MTTSRREVLIATGLGSATAAAAVPEDVVARLARLSHEANAALMRGDIAAYRAMLGYTADFLLMSPFGGTPTRGADMSEEAWARMGRFFRNGSFAQELVQAYASEDMAVLALIERCYVEVGGLPAQEWALRVTLVFRREGEAWRLAHRHADPLVAGVSWAQSAALARGEGRG